MFGLGRSLRRTRSDYRNMDEGSKLRPILEQLVAGAATAARLTGSLLERGKRTRIARNSLLEPRKYALIQP
jgi:hypothetical protein